MQVCIGQGAGHRANVFRKCRAIVVTRHEKGTASPRLTNHAVVGTVIWINRFCVTGQHFTDFRDSLAYTADETLAGSGLRDMVHGFGGVDPLAGAAAVTLVTLTGGHLQGSDFLILWRCGQMLISG